MTTADRLAEIAAEIRQLDSHLIEDERESFDSFDTSASERADATRVRLHALLREYFAVAERRRLLETPRPRVA